MYESFQIGSSNCSDIEDMYNPLQRGGLLFMKYDI